MIGSDRGARVRSSSVQLMPTQEAEPVNSRPRKSATVNDDGQRSRLREELILERVPLSAARRSALFRLDFEVKLRCQNEPFEVGRSSPLRCDLRHTRGGKRK